MDTDADHPVTVSTGASKYQVVNREAKQVILAYFEKGLILQGIWSTVVLRHGRIEVERYLQVFLIRLVPKINLAQRQGFGGGIRFPDPCTIPLYILIQCLFLVLDRRHAFSLRFHAFHD